MTEKNMLENKTVLIVDDEPDILDTLEALLSECIVVRAATFDEAKDLLESRFFDLAIPSRAGMFISTLKWPLLATIAPFFILRKCFLSRTFMSPVAVMKTSPISQALINGTT